LAGKLGNRPYRGRAFSRRGLAARASCRFGGESGENEQQDPQSGADAKIEVVGRLLKRKPQGRGKQESPAEAMEEAEFHSVTVCPARIGPTLSTTISGFALNAGREQVLPRMANAANKPKA
jgi:hypothetical protein